MYSPPSPFAISPLSSPLFISVKENFILLVTQANNLEASSFSNTVRRSLSTHSVGSTSKYIQNLFTYHHSPPSL